MSEDFPKSSLKRLDDALAMVGDHPDDIIREVVALAQKFREVDKRTQGLWDVQRLRAARELVTLILGDEDGS